MRSPLTLTASGIRGRLKRYGLDLAEVDRGAKFVVYRAEPIAEFTSLDQLRGFLMGAETVVKLPPPADGDDE
jgi:hypothetical protein